MEHFGTEAFSSERLIFRAFELSDVDDAYLWASDASVQLEYGEPVYKTIEKTLALINSYVSQYANKNFYRWAIIEKKSNVNIGQIAFCKVWEDVFTAEIEYCIAAKYQGNGYAKEALSALINHIFMSTEFEKLEAYHRKENIKSGKVLEKSCMRKTDNVERFIRQNIIPEGELCYAITKSEYISYKN